MRLTVSALAYLTGKDRGNVRRVLRSMGFEPDYREFSRGEHRRYRIDSEDAEPVLERLKTGRRGRRWQP